MGIGYRIGRCSFGGSAVGGEEVVVKIYILMRGENPLYAAYLKEDLERIRAAEPSFFASTHIVEVPLIFPLIKKSDA